MQSCCVSMAVGVLALAVSFGAIGASPAVAGLPLDAERGVMSFAPMLQRVTPTVVSIAVRTRVTSKPAPGTRESGAGMWFSPFPQPQPMETVGAGSGVIVDAARGYVLTNDHVVAQARAILVTLEDGRTFEAEVVGSDPETDIALLRIEADGLEAAELGDSDHLRVGDVVLAIGNPFGIGQTVTTGIVSALKRNGLRRHGYEDFIQTDAPVNPGNSGGALVDSKGNVVGINTALYSPGPVNVGINLAVPSNMARAVMEQLIAHGEVRRGRIGVALQDLDPALAGSLGLARRGGALVGRVAPGSAAARAGIVQGDVIVAANGRPVQRAADLSNLVGISPIGARLELTLYRNGQERQIETTIAPVDALDPASGAARPRPASNHMAPVPSRN